VQDEASTPTSVGQDVGMSEEPGFRTRAVHAGGRPDPGTGARAVPIYQTSSFVLDDTDRAAELFALQTYGHIYSRISNPTVAAFEERLATLEGGLGGVATSSGQAAEFLTFAALAGQGDHIVASAQLYGGTRTLLEVTLARFGVETTFLGAPEPDAVAAALRPSTKAVYVEVIANPSGMIPDLVGLADVAHAAGVPLVVDSTMATPYLCRPIEHGADIVVHSVTKFIGGHGTSLGGAVIEAGRFPWDNGHFPLMTEPMPSYGGLTWSGNFGEYGFLTRLRSEQLRDVGATMTPFNAFLFLMGLETLALRMRQHVENARQVAEHLRAHPAVAWVAYSGLPDSPWFDRAQRYLPEGPGAVFAFGVRGGRSAGTRFIESVRLASHLANIGDTRTLVIHPASTTHQQQSDEALVAAGIGPDLVRISVGIEDVDDILADLDQALAQSQVAR
jgi:O-acetylhomoserine (thiol)-lyase